MARPLSYDDIGLLELVADLIVSGEAKTYAEAQRKAAEFIPGWQAWRDHKKNQLFDRVRKKCARRRVKLESDAKARLDQRRNMTWLPKFISPSLMDLQSLDPEQQQQDREMLELETGLKDASTWVADLAKLMIHQWLHDKVDPELIAHARELVALIARRA
jgi:hypothetical protein